jgi:hypothetical protein
LRRVTIARRAIRQAGEPLDALGALPPGIKVEVADLIVAAQRASRSEDLGLAVRALESRKAEVEQWLRDASKPVNTNPSGLENEPHITVTNPLSNPEKDTVIAAEVCSRPVEAEPTPPSAAPTRLVSPEKALRVTAAELVDLAPRLAQYVPHGSVTWSHLLDAA